MNLICHFTGSAVKQQKWWSVTHSSQFSHNGRSRIVPSIYSPRLRPLPVMFSRDDSVMTKTANNKKRKQTKRITVLMKEVQLSVHFTLVLKATQIRINLVLNLAIIYIIHNLLPFSVFNTNLRSWNIRTLLASYKSLIIIIID